MVGQTAFVQGALFFRESHALQNKSADPIRCGALGNSFAKGENMSSGKFDLRAISLGAGVQSSAMYLMACEGEFGKLPDVAIFADTQSEPPWVYEHLD